MTGPPTATQLREQLTELAVLWPALPAALTRDAGTAANERVTTSQDVHTLPLNTDVAAVAYRLAYEIPTTAAWAAQVAGQTANPGRDTPTHLHHLAGHYERILSIGHTRDAHRLADDVASWLRDIRHALGLDRPDRPVGVHCPLHDDPLTTLVTPGDRGWLHYDRLNTDGQPHQPWVQWLHTEAITCRHCAAIWAPNRYMFLGRLIRNVDERRAAEKVTPVRKDAA